VIYRNLALFITVKIASKVKVITEPFTTAPKVELTNQLETGKSFRRQERENV